MTIDKKGDKASPKKFIIDFINSTAFLIIILVLWNMATLDGHISKILLPTLGDVWKNFKIQIGNGQLVSDITASLYTVVRGYAIGVILGLFFGVLMGTFPRVNQFSALYLMLYVRYRELHCFR